MVEHGHFRVRLDNGEGKVYAPEQYMPYEVKVQPTSAPIQASTAAPEPKKEMEQWVTLIQ
jgi:hypothetical protein